MPYALIEDAWDQSNFIKKQYSELKEHKKKLIHNSVHQNVIVPENAYDYQDLYNNVCYPFVDHSNDILSVYPVHEKCEEPVIEKCVDEPYVATPQQQIQSLPQQIQPPQKIQQPKVSNQESEYKMNLNKYLNELIIENNNLRQLINQMHMNSDSSSDANHIDLIIYIISGIFIIFMLDSFVNLIKKK